MRCIRCFLAVILAAGVLLPFFSHTEALWPLTRLWHEILILAGLVLNLAFLIQKVRLAGTASAQTRIQTAFTWKELLYWNGAGVLVIVLLIRQATTYVVAWGLMIGLRTIIPGMWIFLIAASPFACREIRNRRKRPTSRLVKFWFSLLLFAALCESVSLLILCVNRTVGEQVTFPESLPRADDDGLHIAGIGGSTTLGWPWHPHYSFPRVAGWQLERALSQHGESAGDDVFAIRRGQVVVHNVARQGDALREDIRQLHRLSVKPDVLMVYTGHNELYQEIDKFSRMSDSLAPRLDHVLSISPLRTVAAECDSRCDITILCKACTSGFPAGHERVEVRRKRALLH